MMANEESNKFPSSPKVPPLKIVLSQHQSNAVVNLGYTGNDDQYKSLDKDNDSDDNRDQEKLARRNSLDDDKYQKKSSKSSSEPIETESGPASSDPLVFSSSSSSSSASSERQSSTTPSSESESLASNSTIISEIQQVKTKSDPKDDTNPISKQDKTAKCGVKFSTAERVVISTGPSGKKFHETSLELTSDSNVSTNSKEQTLNANQRITRSSQRAAQQSKTDNSGEQSIDETNITENLDKNHESARKVKRRKGEPQESEPDAQADAQATITMANVDPADYKLPAQNSFELYRDIRKRPYKKLMKLSHVQPKVPHGFKDYLLNGGPYLLDGNKLGFGLNGAKLGNLSNGAENRNGTNRLPLRLKLSNLHQQRHTSYNIPKVLEAPKNLQVGSPLYELFQDQERARQQMRMQHLKERERSILAAEQEILRAHNKAAIANVKQKLHLSACTYFYYQERYHYLDGKSTSPSKVANQPTGNLTYRLNSDPEHQDILYLKIDDQVKNLDLDSDDSVNNSSQKEDETKNMSDEDLKVLNQEFFLKQLQDIDDKWDKIKMDMLVRHKNEADSLHAVQSLEWEWKAKEIGACDVRISLKIEPEFVPRVEVAAQDY